MFRHLFILITLFLGIQTKAQFTVYPTTLTNLSTTVNESSGVVNLDGVLWTHNDSGGEASLYQIDSATGNVVRTVEVVQATNVDWEDLAYDSVFVYIGDFGNNSGDRTNLKIYRINRAQLATQNSVVAESIAFSYSDQTSWTPSPNQTDFDCEAFIALEGSLYLFSKDWVDHKTRLYQLSNQPGTHVAQYQSTFDAQGLVTSAEMLPNQVLILQAYTSLVSPYTWLFQQFQGSSFFNGMSTKLNWTGFAQTEGVCKADSTSIFISSEKLGFPFNTPARLYYLDLSEYIETPPPSGLEQPIPWMKIYADQSTIHVKSDPQEIIPATIRILNGMGQVLQSIEKTMGADICIPVTIHEGLYLVQVYTRNWVYTGKILVK